MGTTTIIFIAFGLAMDAFAVSITIGAIKREPGLNNALKVGIFFGLFQAAMPLMGWSAGFGFRGLVSRIDHWIAFGLLTTIGCRMIYDSFRNPSDGSQVDPLNPYVLLTLSVATSIDALAVGISLALLKVPILAPVMVIGGVTFLLSFSGALIGGRLGHLFGRRVETVGGLVLIGIGTKILVEHLA